MNLVADSGAGPVPDPPRFYGRPELLGLDRAKVPFHVGIIMDGNGRWANSRGLSRTEGHKVGEIALLDVVAGALEAGVRHLSVYAFSTENWRRSPEEVRFLLGFSRQVIRRQSEILNQWGVEIKWVGQRRRLWKSVISQLEAASKITAGNDKLTLYMCVNYGGQSEIAVAASKLAQAVVDGKLSLKKAQNLSAKEFAEFLPSYPMPEADLIWRTSGEQRLSNFLTWQSVYSEFVFTPEPWPEANRYMLQEVLRAYENRQRRKGGAKESLETSEN